MTARFVIDDGPFEVPCCIGSAEYGPERCTCWRKEHDQVQLAVQAGPPAVRTTMCGDCAFRHDSPERQGDERYANSHEGAVDELALSGTVFFCHQGMRRVVARLHPAKGRDEASPGEYDPALSGGCAFKADGSPADICAGFARAAELRSR
jgi:hypothetical protein